MSTKLHLPWHSSILPRIYASESALAFLVFGALPGCSLTLSSFHHNFMWPNSSWISGLPKCHHGPPWIFHLKSQPALTHTTSPPSYFTFFFLYNLLLSNIINMLLIYYIVIYLLFSLSCKLYKSKDFCLLWLNPRIQKGSWHGVDRCLIRIWLNGIGQIYRFLNSVYQLWTD